MKRRRFLLASAGGALAPGLAFAQTRPVRIGMLLPRPVAGSNFAPGILQRLEQLGYRQGAGMVLEVRSADGFADRYPKLARELIDLKCDVIFALGPALTVRTLRDAGSAVPVVFLAVDYDPVEKGLVASLRKPDGNMTGSYVPQNALVSKRMEFMREVLPLARRFLVFADAFSVDQIRAARKAAEVARVQLTVKEFSGRPYDYSGAFEDGRKAGSEGFMSLASPVFASDGAALGVLLLKHRLPGIGASVNHADSGFLMSFAADNVKIARRVAEIGVQILKGARPADIPVEQADEFELVINAKTARAIGVKIPESVMARATRIVQ